MLSRNQNEFIKANILNWHKAGYTGKGVKIAVMDDGQKPFAHSKEYVQLPYNDHTGGFHKGYVLEVLRQVAPDAELIGLNFFTDPDRALNYVKKHHEEIQIVNCSFGLNLLTAYEGLRNTVPTIICATGNAGEQKVSAPANLDFTVAVGAYSGENNCIKAYSNYGKEVTCVGYTDIYTETDKGVEKFSGTSSAAPFVSGMLALYYQFYKEKTNRFPTRSEAFKFIINSCKDIEDPGIDKYSGNGLFILPNPEEAILLKDIQGHWAEENIKEAVKQGVMKGYPDGTFKPDQPVTRAELAKVICRIQKAE